MTRTLLSAICALGIALSVSTQASAAGGQSSSPALKEGGKTAASETVESRRCISYRAIKRIYVINDYVVVYSLNGEKLYRTTFKRRCNGLEFYRAFTTELRNPFWLCQGDDLLVSYTASSCRLQEFQPISSNDLLRLQYAAQLQREQREKKAKGGQTAD